MTAALEQRRTERIYAAAEERLQRPLTTAELAIDLAQADADLEAGKQRLWDAIDAEKLRVITALLRGLHGRMTVTPDMVAALAWLHERGRAHARDEIRRLGFTPNPAPTLFADDPLAALPLSVRHRVGHLNSDLGGLQVTIENGVVGADLSSLAVNVLADQLGKQIKGAGTIAAALTSGPFDAGLSETYEANEDLFPDGWQYTAIMDGGTCEVCAGADGETYANLTEAFAALPDFGPNPSCLGGDRCRCRLVPVPSEPDATSQPVDVEPAPEPVEMDTAAAIEYYHSPKAFELNAALRDGKTLTAEQGAVVKALDAAFTPAPTDMTLFRGVPNAPDVYGVETNALTRGLARELSTPGYLSTSEQADVALQFASGTAGAGDLPIVEKIAVKAGTPVLRIPAGDFGDQDEWLLPRDIARTFSGAQKIADPFGGDSIPLFHSGVRPAPEAPAPVAARAELPKPEQTTAQLGDLEKGDVFLYQGHRFKVLDVGDNQVTVQHVKTGAKQKASASLVVDRPKPAARKALVGRTAETYLNRSQASHLAALTDVELRDLDNWVGVSYRTINGALRHDQPLGGVSLKRVQNLDSTIAKAPPLTEDVTLWRGVNSYQQAFGTADLDSLVGTTVTDAGFASSTTRQSIALRAMGAKRGRYAAVIKVRAPAGTKGAWISGLAKAAGDKAARGLEHHLAREEGEFLLPRGTRYRVVSVKKGDVPEIEVELVP